jgi:transposase-like protein
MTSKRFTDEFKAEAVKQVTERSYPASEIAERPKDVDGQLICLAAQTRPKPSGM